MALSASAASSALAPHTMQFLGLLADRSVLILVDSRNSHSFISSAIADNLRPLPAPSSVRVADGGLVACIAELPDMEWAVQGHSFHSTLRVLPLSPYDVILGMDWLSAFSPMKVNWQDKWMSIPYGSSTVVLQGLKSSDAGCNIIQLFNITSDHLTEQAPPLPPLVQELLVEFQDLFAEPSSLPPRRDCDHTIPLVPGAQPVSVRQYRYSQKLKTEIEKQVTELLQHGMIQPSNSPFSSPVLLVRKKDHSWRMCVDYRMLNALTVKTKFPILVIDELLDELSAARWFSCLDLRAGFNQIRLAPGEEFKTAFQTHWGQFEYTVMSFGLTGAPNTFQGAMNSTLKPLLRICVIVFFDDILVYSPTFEQHIQDLRQVLSLLAKVQWLVKLSKCRFA